MIIDIHGHYTTAPTALESWRDRQIVGIQAPSLAPSATELAISDDAIREMIGAVRGVDPETGHHYDDTKRYIEASCLTAAQKRQIYAGNARRVYPRLDAALKRQGR